MLQSHGVGWKTRLVLAIGVILAVVFPANALASGGGLTPIGMTVDSGEPATEETPTPGSIECTTSTETGLRTCLPVTPAEHVSELAAAAKHAVASGLDELPAERREKYEVSGRNSKVLVKKLVKA